MAEFDRKAAIRAELSGLSTSEINRITGLRVDGGAQFDSIMEEVRGAVETAYDERMSAGDAVEHANIVTVIDTDRLTYFTEVQAAQSLTAGEVEFDSGASVLDFVAAALEHVFTEGVQAVINHVDAAVDEAERDHIDEDLLDHDPNDWV